ncbi:hypothetical protein PGT21_017749 [Puccinia graminis f. sp. tritici]|uniref:Uncharacterized protein n=1 Tax=Puccinia graminis f. sp. tritici TaxID=56615 RepID=A0A5B0PAA9_PUCGR|nr:hypothetical protein PGT21_017749 [Puccinia graminis f. sp. tritici]KAA1126066.1 hypothetical protein PGTUg99_019544 [Puccinia graminis f. sp. tritici]
MWILRLYSLILLVGSINCAFGGHHGNPCLASSGISVSLREHCCDSNHTWLMKKAGCGSVPPSVKRMA